jgi:hydroxyacylglutathione hydrolase
MILETLALGMYEANCYIYASEKDKKCFVIDPGDEVATILDRIKNLGLDVSYIILTHGHPDHVGAVAELKAPTHARVAIHSDDVSTIKHKFLYSMLGFRPVEFAPDILLSSGEVLKAGELELKVLHTPGHTPGGICLLGDGLVFTGDTLFQMSVGRTDLPGGNTQQLMRSIKENLLTLPDDTIVYPGHGQPTTIGAERKENPFLDVG